VGKVRVPRIGRDTILFIVGLAGIFHETVISEDERAALLVLFATMIGLPAFLRSDESSAESAPPTVSPLPVVPPPMPPVDPGAGTE
jgi:hypothetical protein